MQRAVQSEKDNQPQPSSSAGGRRVAALSSAPKSIKLGGLAESINSSPRAQGLAQMKDDIQHSARVQKLQGLAQQPQANPLAQAADVSTRVTLHQPEASTETAQRQIDTAGTLAHSDRVDVRDDETEHGSSSSCGCGSQQESSAKPAGPKQEKSPAQKKSDGDEDSAPARRQEIPAPDRTGLPCKLKAGVESLSGISLGDVKVHYNSAKPAQLNALAHAQGTDIHVAPGQEKHLPHEAWHIVQQKQGRVRPTMQMKAGVPVNEDKALEREADVMGTRAANIKGKMSEATTQLKSLLSIPHPGISRTVQRITIESLEIATRNDLTGVGLYDGGADQTEQMVIDEYLQRKPKADFIADDHWKAEIKMRAELIKGMALINQQGLFGYNWSENDWSLPGAYWQDIRQSIGNAAFMPKDQTSRLIAVRDLFRSAQNNERYFIDCSFAILAVHYRAFAEAMESSQPGSFDQRFPREKVILHPEGVEKVNIAGRLTAPPGDDLYGTVKVEGLGGLLPGDWVYFQNFSDYERTHSGPAAAWAGEHAIYMGRDQYRGFGTQLVSYAQMVETLIERYNKQGTTPSTIPKKDREESKESLDGQLPGIVEVRRAKHPFQAGR